LEFKRVSRSGRIAFGGAGVVENEDREPDPAGTAGLNPANPARKATLPLGSEKGEGFYRSTKTSSKGGT
jgi:hypothetical protein